MIDFNVFFLFITVTKMFIAESGVLMINWTFLIETFLYKLFAILMIIFYGFLILNKFLVANTSTNIFVRRTICTNKHIVPNPDSIPKLAFIQCLFSHVKKKTSSILDKTKILLGSCDECFNVFGHQSRIPWDCVFFKVKYSSFDVNITLTWIENLYFFFQ